MSMFDITDGLNGNGGQRPSPAYYFLWHLVALGVIKAEFGPVTTGAGGLSASPSPTITGTVWDTIGTAFPDAFEPAVVALIDVGVSKLHPNLRTRIDERSIDLASHRHGATTQAIDASNPHEREEEAPFFTGLGISGLGAIGLDASDTAYLSAFVTELAASKGVVRQLVDGDEAFGSHGTAVAGLVVGEPAAIVQSDAAPAGVDPALLASADGETLSISPNPGVLPYFGVDPFSRLISIRTSFDTDPEQFIAAFLHAWNCRADVILLPRGLPDPVRSRVMPKPDLAGDSHLRANQEKADLLARLAEAGAPGSEIDPYATAVASDRAWAILEKLIVAISRKIPVICAAGNDGESQIIYPARLAASDNGVIAVGAVTPNGLRSGFSNYGEGLTLVAPADDSEVFNRHQLRRDTTHPAVSTDYYDPGRGRVLPFSSYALVTTDLPGIYGYEAGSPPGSARVPPFATPGTGGGYYTTFGGTSGASALVAGVAALAARASKAKNGPAARLDGLQAKAILVQSCTHTTAVRPGTAQLAPDPMNADDEPVKRNKAYYFGAGLLDAEKVVDAVLGP